MFRLMIISNVIVVGLFGLLGSSSVLGMKRQLELKPNISQEIIEKRLDNLFELSMPNMNIVNVLDKKSQQLSVQKRLNKLRITNELRQEEIDSYQKERKILLLSLPSENILRRFQKEKEDMDWRMSVERDKAQEELRKYFKIDPLLPKWRDRKALLREYGSFNVQSLREASDIATWCINTPINLAYALIAKMKEKKLDPSAITVKLLPEEMMKEKENHVVIADCSNAEPIIKLIESNNKTTINFQKSNPAYIRYNPIIAEKDDIYIEQLVTHELNHLLKKDNELNRNLIDMVADCAQISIDKVEEHAAYTKIRLTQEVDADTTLSLTNSKKSFEVMKMSTLYAESYNMLAILKTNEEVRAEIATRK